MASVSKALIGIGLLPLEPTVVLGAVIVAAMLRLANCNTVSAVLEGAGHWRRLLCATAFAFSIIVLLSTLDGDILRGHSRLWFANWFLLSAAGLVAGRVIAARVVAGALARGLTTRNMALIAPPGLDASLPATLVLERDVRLWRVFRLTADEVNAPARGYSGAPFCLADVFAACKTGAADEIVVCADGFDPAALGRLLDALKTLPNATWLYRTTTRPAGSIAVPGDRDLIKVSGRPIDGWWAVLKPVSDRLIAGVGLIALAPLFGAVALAIKLNSPGCVFFRQRRIGFANEEFLVWKFRTMTVTEDGPEVRQAERNDPRVTAVGRLLRVTSLDELPQLINVLKGDMSLIGPRPHAIAHHETYSKLLPGYASRHRVKPGITGLAQIRGLRGPTETLDKMQRRLEQDLEYAERCSIWRDLKILLLTPVYGFINENAH